MMPQAGHTLSSDQGSVKSRFSFPLQIDEQGLGSVKLRPVSKGSYPLHIKRQNTLERLKLPISVNILTPG